MEKHRLSTLDRWNWPSDPDLEIKFKKWLIDFDNLHHRQPNVPEMLEWAYREGVKNGKSEAQ